MSKFTLRHMAAFAYWRTRGALPRLLSIVEAYAAQAMGSAGALLRAGWIYCRPHLRPDGGGALVRSGWPPTGRPRAAAPDTEAGLTGTTPPAVTTMASVGTGTDAHGSATDIAMVLRAHGFLGLDPDGRPAVPGCFSVGGNVGSHAPTVSLVVMGTGQPTPAGVMARPEPIGTLLFDSQPSWFRTPPPVYRSVMPSHSFQGQGVEPLWWTAEGRCVLGWRTVAGRRQLLCGLQIAEEFVRYAQGDPAKVHTATDKTLWGHGHERASYLYEDHILSGHELQPWSDVLGRSLVRWLSDAAGLPRLAPLPGGARAAILLTGDDDQAELSKYDEQIALLDGFPISYFLLPWTRQSPERLAAMPPSVEFGVHVDALEAQDAYAERCQEQSADVAALVKRPLSAVRNHGHLNHGYWEQQPAWRAAGIRFDVNVRGLDGTCPTGSYLPHRLRAAEGLWTDHWTLFSTFSDSMLFMQKWPEKKQIRCIEKAAAIIEAGGPGILVINMHPQNVSLHRWVHKAILAIGRRRGWTALGVESFLAWLDARDSILLRVETAGFVLTSAHEVWDVAVHMPGRAELRTLAPWTGAIQL